MYGQTQEKTWGCLPWYVSTFPHRLSEVEGMCRAITTGTKAVDRHAGYARTQLTQKWGYFHSSKANGDPRMVKQKQPKCCNERAFDLWPHRKNKARQSPRLQSFCHNSLSTQLRYEETGCVFRDIQTNRLHGAECETGSTSNTGPPS